jgi:hypothetical protein
MASKAFFHFLFCSTNQITLHWKYSLAVPTAAPQALHTSCLLLQTGVQMKEAKTTFLNVQ